MRFRLLAVATVASSAMLWATIGAAIAVGFPVPRGGAWEGPVTGRYNQHVGSVKFCVTGDRVERIAVTIDARGGRIEANLGHTSMFETVTTPDYHDGPAVGPFRRETRFQIIDHKVDARLSLSMVVQWAHIGPPQHPIGEHQAAHGRLSGTEEGRLGQTTLNERLGPIDRVGDC